MLLLLLCAGLSSLAARSAEAGSGLYTFIDARGVVHFSNAPVDARYRKVARKAKDGASITPTTRPFIPRESGFDSIIAKTALRFGVDAALAKAVIAAESNFQVDAVSRAGAQGLMQLMPATAAEMGVQSPFVAHENIRGGVRYLRVMLDRYGDVTRALAAYNAGPTAVDHYRGIPPYPETQAYVARVLKYYRGYQGEFPRR